MTYLSTSNDTFAIEHSLSLAGAEIAQLSAQPIEWGTAELRESACAILHLCDVADTLSGSGDPEQFLIAANNASAPTSGVAGPSAMSLADYGAILNSLEEEMTGLTSDITMLTEDGLFPDVVLMHRECVARYANLIHVAELVWGEVIEQVQAAA